MNKNLITGIVAVVLGFVVGIVLAMILGITFENGFDTYWPHEILAPMLKSFTGFDITGQEPFRVHYIGEFIVSSVPLILTGLSVAFAFKTGLFNIGAEGQLMIGALVATLCGIYLDLPPVIHPIVCVVLAAFAGFLYGFIPGFLKAKFNVHEVVTCIMLNYTAMYFANMIYRGIPGFHDEKTPMVKESASLSSKFLSGLTDGSRLNWSILLVVISAIAFWFIINKTTFGYRLKAIGNNKEAARYAGMNVNQGIMFSMGISGVFAALAGATLVLGVFGHGRTLSAFENYGYNGIAVALVGANTAIGVIFSGGLFGILAVAQPIMQSGGIPKDIAVIISALIILFCAIPALYNVYIDKWLDKRAEKKKRKQGLEKKDSGGAV
ncbi:MAG: ABC transporter permease [Coprobacillus sp.]